MRRLASALAALAFLGSGAAAAGLTEEQRRGQQIYLTGKSPAGDAIEAVLGGGQTIMPAALFPCARCHGGAGGGREEGGVTAPDITWHALTKPYALQRSDRSARPPYDRDALVIRAFSLGIDAGGRALNQVMPRYRMSRADAQSLLAYLKVLGSAAEPGVTEDRLTIAVPATPAGTGLADRDWVPGLLAAHFDRVNREGGIYGRRIELRRYPPQTTGTAGLPEILRQDPPLALLAPFADMPGLDLSGVAKELGLPVVAGRPPRGGETAGQAVFFALPDLAMQARVLARVAADLPGGADAPVTVVHDGAGAAARAAADALERSGATARIVEHPAGEAARAAATSLAAGGDRLILLTQDPRLLAAAGPDRPLVVLAPEHDAPALLAGAQLPAGSRLFLSRASSPADVSAGKRARLGELGDGLALEGARIDDVQAVLATAEILVEALRRSGRSVTRRGLTEALEGLYRYPTGYLRPVSFGPNRRIGARGAYVVERDPRTGRALASWWIAVD